MPVTQTILNMALEHANGHRVTDIYLEVGQFSAIVPSSVEVFFEHLSKETSAEGATLHFKIAPMEMTCVECGADQDLSAWREEVPQSIMMKAIKRGCACGSKNIRVTGGLSCQMTSVDIDANEA